MGGEGGNGSFGLGIRSCLMRGPFDRWEGKGETVRLVFENEIMNFMNFMKISIG